MTVEVNGVVSNNLTTGVDIAVVTGTGKDQINGLVYNPLNPDYSTFTPGDEIVGNGKTVLDLKVTGWTGSFGLPGVTMSGVKTLNINNLVGQTSAAAVDADAAEWGDSFKKVAVSGAAGLELELVNLTAAGGKLNVTASGANNSVLITAASVGDSAVTVDLTNSTNDTTNAKAVTNANKIVAKGGAGDSVEINQNVGEADSTANVGKLKAESGALGSSTINLTSAGSIAAGDVDATASGLRPNTPANHTKVTVDVQAAIGDEGDITVGAVNATSEDGGDVEVFLGNDKGQAAKASSATTVESITASASSDVASDINVIVTGIEGATSTGGITISATGASAHDVLIEMTTTDLGSSAAAAVVSTGDIVASASGAATHNIDVILTSNAGPNDTIVIGDVSVSGANAGLNMIAVGGGNSWLSDSGTVAVNLVSIGDIDYSAFTGSATIDLTNSTGLTVSDTWAGAAIIKAAAGGGTITGNAGVNTYVLAANTAADTIQFVTQTAGLTIDTNVDVVRGFRSADDTLNFVTSTGVGTTTVVGTAAVDMAAFLTSAGSTLGAGNGAYAQLIGSDWYVAVNNDATAGLDYIVKVEAPNAALTSADIGYLANG